MALLFAMCVAPAPALAERGVITPAIAVKSIYNDNVHFKKHTDFEWRVTPSVTMEYGQEDWSLSSGGTADIFRYTRLTEYDRENYSLWVEGEKSLTERLRASCRGSFDYNHTFESELAESGSITTQALRRSYSLVPGLSWDMSEKDNLSLSLPYAETIYTGSNNADTVTKGGTASWSHVLNNQRTSLLGQFTYTNYHFNRTDGYTDQDVYNMMGGMRYAPTELFEITGFMGIGHARSYVTFNSLTNVSSTSTFFSFDLSGTYHREKWEFTLGADRQASPSTDGEVTVRTRAKASGKYSFTERLSASLDCAYYQTKSGGLISESKNRTYYLRPWIGYKLTEDASINLEFRHLNSKNLLTEEVQKQNQTALRFEYHYPWFF